MSRRRSQELSGTWTNYVLYVPLVDLRRCLVNDLSGHTDCCGSECKLFHLGLLLCNSLYRDLEACTLLLLVVSVYTLSVETAVNKCIVLQTSMYVQAYPELSLHEVSCGCCSFRGSSNWERGPRFLVAVAGCALVAVACLCWVVMMRLRRNGPPCLIVSPSHLHNGPCPN